jgi:hypothetical protein
LLKDSAIAEVPFCFQQLLTFSATAETGPLPLRMWFLATDFISRTMFKGNDPADKGPNKIPRLSDAVGSCSKVRYSSKKES